MPRWYPVSDAEYIERFKSRCIMTASGCWEWQRGCQPFRNMKPGQRGYAAGCYRGKNRRLNRLMLELRLGRPLHPGMHACHKCDNPPCINPDHLYEATNQQNHLDGGKRKRMQGQLKTHCNSGHEFTPENTYWAKRGLSFSRSCKECNRLRCLARYHADPERARAKLRHNRALAKQRRQLQQASDQ